MAKPKKFGARGKYNFMFITHLKKNSGWYFFLCNFVFLLHITFFFRFTYFA